MPESDIQALPFGLIDDALDENDEYTDEINIDQLRNVLHKHDGLVENLTIRSSFYTNYLLLNHLSLRYILHNNKQEHTYQNLFIA